MKVKQYCFLRVGFIKWQVSFLHIVMIGSQIDITFITFSNIGD